MAFIDRSDDRLFCSNVFLLSEDSGDRDHYVGFESEGVMRDHPTIGTCDKCSTENSELHEYRTGVFLCKANECWQEEVERDSGRHIRLNQKLEDYRSIVNRSG